MSGYLPCETGGCYGDARYAAPGRGHIAGCRYPLDASDPAVRLLVERETPTPAVPDPTVEALSEVLRTHRIECTGVGEVTCGACRELRWMTWPDYHAHVATKQAEALAARAAAPDALRVRIEALADEWESDTADWSVHDRHTQLVADLRAVLEDGAQ